MGSEFDKSEQEAYENGFDFAIYMVMNCIANTCGEMPPLFNRQIKMLNNKIEEAVKEIRNDW